MSTLLVETNLIAKPSTAATGSKPKYLAETLHVWTTLINLIRKLDKKAQILLSLTDATQIFELILTTATCHDNTSFSIFPKCKEAINLDLRAGL